MTDDHAWGKNFNCTNTPAASGKEIPAGSGRLLSLDALRGFDMFWIIGGDGLFLAAAQYKDWPILKWMAGQLTHPFWGGFTFYDLIFPLFLFIAGVAIPFSLCSRLEKGTAKWKLYLRITKRAVLLILLGIVYNGGLEFAGVENTRFASVLGLIGVGYFFAAMIVMLFKNVRWQLAWLVFILITYWAMMKFVPVPQLGAGVMTPEGNLSTYIDQQFLPGRFHFKLFDPEGILPCYAGIAMALAGVMTGHWLRLENKGKWLKALGLLAGGIVCVVVGKLWGMDLPIIKNIWTSTFVVYTAGLSLLLLCLFYVIIDVLQLKKWAFVFVLIGMNPITIYMAGRIVNFGHIADFLFGGMISHCGEPVRPLLLNAAVLLLEILLLYFLYRKKVFLKL